MDLEIRELVASAREELALASGTVSSNPRRLVHIRNAEEILDETLKRFDLHGQAWAEQDQLAEVFDEHTLDPVEANMRALHAAKGPENRAQRILLRERRQ